MGTCEICNSPQIRFCLTQTYNWHAQQIKLKYIWVKSESLLLYFNWLWSVTKIFLDAFQKSPWCFSKVFIHWIWNDCEALADVSCAEKSISLYSLLLPHRISRLLIMRKGIYLLIMSSVLGRIKCSNLNDWFCIWKLLTYFRNVPLNNLWYGTLIRVL